MRLLTIFCASLLSSACNGQASIQCIGDDMSNLTKVVFEENGVGGLTVRYPSGSNAKVDVDTIYSSEAFLVLGTASDWGVGIWHINKQTNRFQYLQSKDLTIIGKLGFNSDDYQGSCSALSGDIGQL